jgi:hypothetical protein
MFRSFAACAAALAVVAATGCATPSDGPVQAREQPVYRTGSNLPVREGGTPVGNVKVESVDPTNPTSIQRPRPGVGR